MKGVSIPENHCKNVSNRTQTHIRLANLRVLATGSGLPAPAERAFSPQLPAGIQGFQVDSCSLTHFSAAASAVMPPLVM